MNITEALLLKYYKKECNHTEQLAVENWLKNSKSNQIYYQNITSIWEASILNAKNHLPINNAWNKVEKRIIPNNSKIKSLTLRTLSIAASICIIATLSWYIFNTVYSTQTTTSPTTFAQIVNNSDTIQSHTLPDGTIVWLKEQSSIEISATYTSHRAVSLQGEAYFVVTKDSLNPLTITTDYSEIKVLGTEFNVKPENNNLTVTVLSGKVALKNQNSQQQVLLTKGFEGKSSIKGSVSVSDKINPNNFAWKTGKLYFENEKIETVYTLLEDIYNVNIKTLSPEISNEIITSSFDNQSIDEIMSIISLTLDIKFTKNNNTYIVSKK